MEDSPSIIRALQETKSQRVEGVPDSIDHDLKVLTNMVKIGLEVDVNSIKLCRDAQDQLEKIRLYPML